MFSLEIQIKEYLFLALLFNVPTHTLSTTHENIYKNQEKEDYRRHKHAKTQRREREIFYNGIILDMS